MGTFKAKDLEVDNHEINLKIKGDEALDGFGEKVIEKIRELEPQETLD